MSQQLTRQGWEVEIVVVNDGSTDRTAEKAHEFNYITLLDHYQNRGYGAAPKTGIRHSDARWICITDADDTYPNERIPDLLTHGEETHSAMAVGVRTGENVKIPVLVFVSFYIGGGLIGATAWWIKPVLIRELASKQRHAQS